MPQVLVCDPIAEEGIELLRQQPDIEVDVRLKLPEEEIVNIVPGYAALMVRSETKVTRRIMAAAAHLQIIGRAGVGVDNIDVEAATERGILVVNAPEGNTIAATEHTLGLMLAMARNIPQANNLLKQGIWERKKFTGVELRNKVLGIIGLGKIGSEVAKRAKAFEMRVIAYDPYVTEEKARSLGVEVKGLEEVLAEADFITVHLPLTSETRHLIGHHQIAIMRDGVRLLNVARGGIIDEEALYEALRSGKVAAAAIDVFEKEPAADSPLMQLDNVVATPHLGASTAEAQVNVAVEVAQDIIRAFKDEPVKNAVNIPVVKPELREVLQPYFDLLERLGRFATQSVEGRAAEIELRYNGELASYDVGPLTNTFLKGFLRPALGDNVNYVNAPVLARSRGIKVAEHKTVEMLDYANLVSVHVATDRGTRRLAGTLTGRGEPHLVQFDAYRVDAILEGHLLIIPHWDRPRIIGPVASKIGEYNVNIAGMQVGRKEVGGQAVMLLAIDDGLPPGALGEIARVDGVLGVMEVDI